MPMMRSAMPWDVKGERVGMEGGGRCDGGQRVEERERTMQASKAEHGAGDPIQSDSSCAAN